MINVTTTIKPLAEDICEIIDASGFVPRVYAIPGQHANQQLKYVIRVARKAKEFQTLLNLYKS